MNRELLEKPFEPEFIKQRKGNFGQMLDYIETHVVIQRLNDVFDGNWNFEIVSHEQRGDELVVIGKLTADGISKMQFGSKKITTSKQGEVISIGDDLKSASSDALKKTATLLGVGLHLYGEVEASDGADPSQPTDKNTQADMSKMSGSKSDSNGITKDQLAQIKKLRTQLKWTVKDIEDKAERMFATRDVTKLNSVMGSALIAFLENQNGDDAQY
jgi:hypothetical protein